MSHLPCRRPCIFVRFDFLGNKASYFILLIGEQTCIISAFDAPHETKTAHRELFITGNVRVIRSGGGLGESLIAATHLFFS